MKMSTEGVPVKGSQHYSVKIRCMQGWLIVDGIHDGILECQTQLYKMNRES